MARGNRSLAQMGAHAQADPRLDALLEADRRQVDASIRSAAPADHLALASYTGTLAKDDLIEVALAYATLEDHDPAVLSGILRRAEAILAEDMALHRGTGPYTRKIGRRMAGAEFASLAFYGATIAALGADITRREMVATHGEPARARWRAGTQFDVGMDELLAEYLRDGDLLRARAAATTRAARSADAGAPERVAGFDDEDWEGLMRLARANAILADVGTAPAARVSEAALSLTMRPRDRVRALAATLGENDATAQARQRLAIRRTPRQGAPTGAALWHSRVREALREGAPTRVRVPLAVAREVINAHAESDGWRGARVYVHERPGRQSTLFLQLAMQVEIEDGPRVVEAVTELKGTTAKRDEGIRKAVARQMDGAGLDPESFAWEIARERMPGVGAPDDGPTPRLDTAFGREACRHEHGVWDTAGDWALLRCETCARPAVARIPRHQIPDGHDARAEFDNDPTGSRRSHYAARFRARAVMRGEDDPGVSWDDLRREPAAIMDPTHYAIVAEVPKPRRRPAGFGAALGA